MNLIFVRHGKTKDLEEAVSQSHDSGLSELGVSQAKKLAERLKGEKVDLILSSTMARAKQTAELINERLNVALETFEDLVEVRKPSMLVGRKRDEPEFQQITQQLVDNFHSNWHHSDEENFEDAKMRAVKTLSYIRSLNKETIMIVSHGTFMRLLISLLMFGESCSSHDFIAVNYFFGMDTTGVARVDQGGWSGNWRLVSWNDTSHLK